MAIDFPNSPSLNQLFTVGDLTWRYDGSKWVSSSSYLGVQKTQGSQGVQGFQAIQGNLGSRSPQGEQGIEGAQGIQGTQGTRAVQGIRGLQTLQGLQGAQGIQGTQGVLVVPNINSSYYFEIRKGTTTTLTTTQSRLYLVPFAVHNTITVTSMSCEVGTAAAGSSVRFGLYNYDLTDNQPGSLILGTTTVSTSTTTGIRTVSALSQELTPGLYFAAMVAQGGAPVVRVVQTTSKYFTSTGINTGTNPISACYQDGVTGALSGTPTIAGEVRSPRIIIGV